MKYNKILSRTKETIFSPFFLKKILTILNVLNILAQGKNYHMNYIEFSNFDFKVSVLAGVQSAGTGTRRSPSEALPAGRSAPTYRAGELKGKQQ